MASPQAEFDENGKIVDHPYADNLFDGMCDVCGDPKELHAS